MTDMCKWIRAVIETYVNLMYPDSPRVILWAIDHGFPMVSDITHVKALPDSLASKHVNHIYFGGLSDIVPSERVNFSNYAFLQFNKEII